MQVLKKRNNCVGEKSKKTKIKIETRNKYSNSRPFRRIIEMLICGLPGFLNKSEYGIN